MNRVIPLYLIAICDILGWGIALAVFAPLMLTAGDFSHAFSTMSARAIFLGILFSLYSLAQFIAFPLINEAASKYGRRQTLVVTTMGSCAAFFLSAISIWVNSFSIMFISRLIAGFFCRESKSSTKVYL